MEDSDVETHLDSVLRLLHSNVVSAQHDFRDEDATVIEVIELLKSAIDTNHVALVLAVQLARSQSFTWEDLAGALDVSRQAVWEAFHKDTE